MDPSYTLSTTIALLSSTTLYSYAPYLTVDADSAIFTCNVTFSGYLKYSWLEAKLLNLYFDIDTTFSAALELTATIDSSYNKTFTYSPSTLFYGISVPGVIELGPELLFSIDALVAASEKVDITAGLGVALADGKVHINLLNDSSSTSGWKPSYSASANISGQAVAQINPTAALTVEIAIEFFGGVLDLSTGVTVSPGFENTFTLTGAEGVDLSGVTNLTSSGTCADGLKIESSFNFGVDVFLTEWYSKEVYSLEVPILDKCYSWA